MDINAHTTPERLEKYAFYWNESRLAIAACALFLGGVPPVIYLFPMLSLSLWSLLRLFWLISGIASAYLGWRWWKGGKRLFGGTAMKDMYAFLVSVVTGINLGLVPVLGRNIGMSITSNRIVYLVVGLVYLATAAHLWKRWKSYGERLF